MFSVLQSHLSPTQGCSYRDLHIITPAQTLETVKTELQLIKMDKIHWNAVNRLWNETLVVLVCGKD